MSLSSESDYDVSPQGQVDFFTLGRPSLQQSDQPISNQQERSLDEESEIESSESEQSGEQRPAQEAIQRVIDYNLNNLSTLSSIQQINSQVFEQVHGNSDSSEQSDESESDRDDVSHQEIQYLNGQELQQTQSHNIQSQLYNQTQQLQQKLLQQHQQQLQQPLLEQPQQQSAFLQDMQEQREIQDGPSQSVDGNSIQGTCQKQTSPKVIQESLQRDQQIQQDEVGCSNQYKNQSPQSQQNNKQLNKAVDSSVGNRKNIFKKSLNKGIHDNDTQNIRQHNNLHDHTSQNNSTQNKLAQQHLTQNSIANKSIFQQHNDAYNQSTSNNRAHTAEDHALQYKKVDEQQQGLLKSSIDQQKDNKVVNTLGSEKQNGDSSNQNKNTSAQNSGFKVGGNIGGTHKLPNGIKSQNEKKPTQLMSPAAVFKQVDSKPPEYLKSDYQKQQEYHISGNQEVNGRKESNVQENGFNKQKRKQKPGENFDIASLAPPLKGAKKMQTGQIEALPQINRQDNGVHYTEQQVALMGGHVQDKSPGSCSMKPEEMINKGGQQLPRKNQDRKDKEKKKRQAGQSSHTHWKSEEEMAMRQQFDA